MELEATSGRRGAEPSTRSCVAWFLAGAITAAAGSRFAARAGVTDAEAFASLPGDGLIAHPMVEWTRGVTVAAPADEVWPWLVQAGYGRAGWYTPTWIDRLMEPTLFRTVIRDRPNDDVIHPDLQDLAVGDVVADGPDHAAFFRVVHLEPERALVYHSIRHPWRGHPVDASDPDAFAAVDERVRDGGTYLDFTWAFVLVPHGEASTRLLVRTRANYSPRMLAPLVPAAGLFDATYGVAMLRAIARRAESRGA